MFRLHDLIEKLQALEAKNPEFECWATMNTNDENGENDSFISDDLPEIVLDESDPNYLSIDFYARGWRLSE